MNKRALIIGGGFAGCCAAHQLELQGGWDVTLIEKILILAQVIKHAGMGGTLILLAHVIF